MRQLGGIVRGFLLYMYNDGRRALRTSHFSARFASQLAAYLDINCDGSFNTRGFLRVGRQSCCLAACFLNPPSRGLTADNLPRLNSR